MSLKCSIFGHRFGEPSVERDRDESGSEVVITIRETQTCDRCGHERVVSENKEVTTLETPDEESAQPTDEAADDSPTVPDEVDDLAAVNAGESDDTSSPGTEESYDPETDDATIIEDSPEQSIVEEAEPDAPADDAAAPGTVEGSASADDAATDDDDAVILEEDADADAGEASDDPEDRDPGAWPEEPADESPEWEPPTDLGTESATAADESSPDVEPVGEAVTVPQGTFRCPECGFTTPVESSSLREGDFCPDCHTGTLEHDPDAE